MSELQQIHLLIVEDGKGRRELVLDAPIYSLGRDPKCDICLFSQFASRRHATLMQFPNGDGSHYYRIMDGDLKGKTSRNGLQINSRHFQAHNLADGDEVRFGQDVVAFYYLIAKAIDPKRVTGGFDSTAVWQEQLHAKAS